MGGSAGGYNTMGDKSVDILDERDANYRKKRYVWVYGPILYGNCIF